MKIASALVILTLFGTIPAYAQSMRLPELGSPPFIRGRGFDHMLPPPPIDNFVWDRPSLSRPPQLQLPPLLQPISIYLMNSGTEELSVLFVNPPSQICADFTIQAAETQTLASCGKYLVWNDNATTRAIALESGHAYQFYWNESAWAIKDVSTELFNSGE